MTRREMIAHMNANLLLDQDSPLWGYAGASEDLALDTAADETAQATDCYYAEQIGDLVNGQSAYCFPKIYKVKSVEAVDSSGHRVGMPMTSITRMDNIYRRSGWRYWDSEAFPRYAVMSSLTRFLVAPVAKTTVANGLIVAGFALPSLPKAGHDRHQWDTDDDVCPLPEWAHDAVVLKATARRCLVLAAKDKSFLALKAQYENEWQAACGEIEAQATQVYQQSGGQGLK